MAKKAYLGDANGKASNVKKSYMGVKTLINLFDENGTVSAGWNGSNRPDLNYKNEDGTFTFKNNYSTLIYGQDLYGKVVEGKTYTLACEIVSAKCPGINIGIECKKDGSRWFDNGGNFPPIAGTTIARALTVPSSGCTVVLFALAINGYITDGDEHITVKDIRIVEGSYTADTIHLAGTPVARFVKRAYIGNADGMARRCYAAEHETHQYFMPHGSVGMFTADGKTFMSKR